MSEPWENCTYGLKECVPNPDNRACVDCLDIRLQRTEKERARWERRAKKQKARADKEEDSARGLEWSNGVLKSDIHRLEAALLSNCSKSVVKRLKAQGALPKWVRLVKT